MRFLVPFLALFCAQAALAMAIVPPWQNPDEPQHLITVRLVMLHGPDFSVIADHDLASERAIIESMVRYRWWEHYAAETPDPLPETFADGPSKVVSAYFGPPDGGSRFYYRAMAALFQAIGSRDLLSQLSTMRTVSAVCGALTLIVVWLGGRTLFDDLGAFVLTAVTAFHPQFVIVSTTASPDAVVNLAGAAVWWQAAALVTGPLALPNVALLGGAALLGFMTRRMGATLLVVAAAVMLIVLGRTFRKEVRGGVPWLAGAAAVVVVLLAGLMWAPLPEDVRRAAEWATFDPVRAITTTVMEADQLPEFLGDLFSTFWLSAGWRQYHAPAWWQLVTAVLVLVALGGTLVAWRRVPESRPAVRLAAGVAAVQVGVVVAFYFGVIQTSPQGRYLFPVLPALFTLLWIGWKTLVWRHDATRSAVALTVLMAVLNVSGWIFVILPAYA